MNFCSFVVRRVFFKSVPITALTQRKKPVTTSLQELLDQKNKLERQISELQNSKRGEAIATIKALMAGQGLTVADLSATASSTRRAVKTTGKKVAAKYRDPQTGATWTGRGLKPKWMAEAIANGKQVTDFAI